MSGSVDLRLDSGMCACLPVPAGMQGLGDLYETLRQGIAGWNIGGPGAEAMNETKQSSYDLSYQDEMSISHTLKVDKVARV